YRRNEIPGSSVSAARSAVGSNEVRIAETAERRGPIFFPAGPKIAPGEPAKHGDAACQRAFALECLEDFLHAVAQGISLCSTSADQPDETVREQAVICFCRAFHRRRSVPKIHSPEVQWVRPTSGRRAASKASWSSHGRGCSIRP